LLAADVSRLVAAVPLSWLGGAVEAFFDGATTDGLEKQRFIGLLFAIAPAIVVGFSLQWMATSSACFYTQASFTQAVAIASTERRPDLYMENIQSAVLTKGAWLFELVNEAWP